jgi:hypothetical protein
MNKILFVAVVSILCVGCGNLNREVAKFTGYSRSCVDGVSYLQFPSGVTVEYTPNGKIKTCS